ncbi:MAG: LicD family protein [Atopobiaceae bacterium]|nr:LicD family protein [Atopobiaceae bacterium]
MEITQENASAAPYTQDEALEKVHELGYSMLAELIAICERHHLRYYLIGGSLLGAVRHKGFIPWDDDIDVGMPRPDYDVFLRIANEELPEYLELHDYRTAIVDEHINYAAKLYDMRTLLEVGYAQRLHRNPYSLDVFPFDGMPTEPLKQAVHKFAMLFSKMRIMFSMYDVAVHQHRAHRPLHERLLMRFREITKFGADWDTKEMMEKADRIFRLYPYDSSELVLNVYSSYKFGEMYPIEWMGEGVKLPFGPIMVNCPVEWDKVLTHTYGDYMELPPVERRGMQHCITILKLPEGM